MTNIPQEQEPFIPPYFMLLLALGGIVVAAIVALTQPAFTVVGWGALGITVLSLVAWVFMAPDQARAVITGRTARYGGTTLLVTVVFIAALVAIYALVRAQNWSADLTQTAEFSLNDQSREVITGLGADPNLPRVKILAFYSQGQASVRDQHTLLFEDYAQASGGKISYEFVDPDRNPALISQIETALDGTSIVNGQLVVAALDENGNPILENAETLVLEDNPFDPGDDPQTNLTNAILKVAASGDFRAYFLNVENGMEFTDMSVLTSDMTDVFDWTAQAVSMNELTGQNPEITLNDPAADGEVLVIPGGGTPLTDDELKVVTDYVNQGGDLVVLAGLSVEDNTSLATAENLSNYLWENFGLRFRNDVVLDPTLSAQQTPLLPIAETFDAAHPVTSSFPSDRGLGVVFEAPHSIEIAPTLPPNVTVSELILSSEGSYAKSDINTILNNELAATEEDPKGPFVLGAAAENTQTGARVILYGSPLVFADISGQSIVNRIVALNTLAWATNFDEFFNQINVQSIFQPQDAPVFANDQVLRNITLVTVVLLPFGVLAIGLLVWWNNRERGARSTAPAQEG